jgi:hypothetical protein
MNLCAKTLPVSDTDPDFDANLEADLLGEEMSGKATRYKTTTAAIAALEKRVTYLRALLNKAVAENPTGIIADLRQAEADLAGYRRQHDARN